ncbi:hypothetical protein HN615_17670 [Candidatus Woesearchaeota archaeon]|jgi:hypothetical protein|nr:hypothetical protein [Candidatus Woesearchaeota archaeon]
MLYFVKYLSVLVISIILALIIVLGLSQKYRHYVISNVIYFYNLHQIGSIESNVRNSDFDLAATRLKKYIEDSKSISSGRSKLTDGIDTAIGFIEKKVFLKNELNKFSPALEELVSIDDNWYKAHVLLARTESNTLSALKHADKAIGIIESNEGAYREAIRILQLDKDYNSSRLYCEKYSNSKFGGVVQSTHEGAFYDIGINRIAVIFDENADTVDIYPNDGLKLNSVDSYEFIPHTPISTDYISLLLGFPAGVRMDIIDMKVYTNDGSYLIPGNRLLLSTRNSYIIDDKESIGIITTGYDEKIYISMPNELNKIKKITFKLQISRMPIASKRVCNG